MTDFEALWAAVLHRPLDAAPRLVLADWVDEFGDDPDLARGLRIVAFFPVADVKCRYKRKGKRTTWLLQQLREREIISKGSSMSQTYTNGSVYNARIVKWGVSEAKTGTAQAFFKVLILNESDGKGGTFDCPEFERTIYRAITEKTVDRLVDDIARLGVELESFAQLDPENPKAVAFDGVEVEVRCKHESYNGKPTEKFDFNFGGGEPKAIESTGLSKLDKLFGSRLKKAAADKKGPTKAQPANAAPSKTPTEKEAEEVF